MTKTAYIGIDYGLGKTNVDVKTGIRYGVISQHSLGEGFYDAQELDYGAACCPKCGNDAKEIPSHGEQHANGGVTIVVDMPAAYEAYECAKHECADYACEHCEYLFGSESAFGDEPIGWSIDDGEIQVQNCLDSDAMVVRSPFYTFAQFCSPCVPGACSLDSPMDNGAKCYCFGHDWFDGGVAPYPVYSVATNERILP